MDNHFFVDYLVVRMNTAF